MTQNRQQPKGVYIILLFKYLLMTSSTLLTVQKGVELHSKQDFKFNKLKI